ncbi:hypothetical protein EHS25_002635 [Saitozyma podzolica]|uniref:Uncharacterized protein n=1 Tax=Saitozyma podzolica TaxID=1890683 RepID=A0A427YD38_9TREE|nr:hypothetical protein EHS25_002635 [Saitozyma podzolica]
MPVHKLSLPPYPTGEVTWVALAARPINSRVSQSGWVQATPRSTHIALFNISPTQSSSSEAATISGFENATTGQSGPNNINITALQDLPPPTDPGSEYTTNNTARGPERRDSKSNSSTTVEESGSDVEGQPTVLVGVMRICSRPTADEDFTCTSSSQASYHAAFLPLSLGWALLALPTSPPGPVLLLVTATMIILSLFAFAIPLIPFGLLWQRTRQALRLSGRRSVAGDSESTHNLVLHNYPLGQNGSAEDGIDRINLGFLVLSLSTLVLSIASAGVEFAEINRARSTWDPSEASEVGLKWSIGGAAYMLAVFPCVQLQAILAGTTPVI